MNVLPGPFTLWTLTALVMAMRLVSIPLATAPPASYTPFVTSTVSPVVAALIASWRIVAAVAQLVYGDTGLVLEAET
ncbi:MAG: hypothetical protein BWK77_03780 [Verrucomicrobia bacterium A1]|nr:MAG: hypothetical protein BWK77_03780 [Verrucomicrobia bacterium A1]